MLSTRFSMSAVAMTVMIFSGCSHLRKQPERKVEYVPGHLRVESIKKGDPAPIDGFVIPPSVMAEIGPCLAEAMNKDKTSVDQFKPTPVERVPLKLEAPEPASDPLGTPTPIPMQPFRRQPK